MNENNLLNIILENSKKHINKTIYTYIFLLMKYIFIGKQNFANQFRIEDTIQKLKKFTAHINKYIIINEENFIKIEPNEKYTYKNFNNIIKFIKSQNLMYAGNILEGILIIIFNYSIKTSKEDNFGKYISKNFEKFRDSNNKDLPSWFSNSKEIFDNKELESIYDLLAKDLSIKDKNINNNVRPIFHKFLFEIISNKFNILKENKNKELLKEMEIYLSIYKSMNHCTSYYEQDYKENSIIMLYYYFIHKKQCPIKIIYCFLMSIYIYYQNTNLINLNSSENDDTTLENIPYTYQLKDYKVEGRFSNVITSPMTIEPRIINVDFMQNNIREIGLFELGKILSFNKNIKTLNLKSCLINNFYLEIFVRGFTLFDNYTLEELNLSKNSLKEYADYPLSELIKHLKGLKTLNIFGNTEAKGGFRLFFITLKSLYKKGKTNLENLNINNCYLTDSSFYELGELLKSPYCGLKRLNIALNKKSRNIDFLKTLKYNRSLEELIIYKCDLSENDIDDVCRIISNSNIKKINLFRNKFHVFRKTLRIVFRGKLINKIGKKINKQKVDLSKAIIHLDLSNNYSYLINHHYIMLINKFIESNSNINCLDLSHILYGKNADMRGIHIYKEEINKLSSILSKKKEAYWKLTLKKLDLERNKEIYQKKEEEEKLNLNDLDEEINEYLEEQINSKNENSIFPAYLREKNYYIIEKIIIKNKEKYDKLIKKEKIDDKNIKSYNNEKFIHKIIDYIKFKKNENELISVNRELEWKQLVII